MQQRKVIDLVYHPVMLYACDDGDLLWVSVDTAQGKVRQKKVRGPIAVEYVLQATAEEPGVGEQAAKPAVSMTMGKAAVAPLAAEPLPKGGIIAISLNENEC